MYIKILFHKLLKNYIPGTMQLSYQYNVKKKPTKDTEISVFKGPVLTNCGNYLQLFRKCML